MLSPYRKDLQDGGGKKAYTVYRTNKILCSIPFRKDLQAEAERKKQNRKDSDPPGEIYTTTNTYLVYISTVSIYQQLNHSLSVSKGPRQNSRATGDIETLDSQAGQRSTASFIADVT